MLDEWGGCGFPPAWPSWLTDLWMTLSPPLSLRSHTPQQCHICPAAQSATIWNGFVLRTPKSLQITRSLVSLRMLSLMTMLAFAVSVAKDSDHFQLVLNVWYIWLSVALHSFSLQAGLLGCEAVLSSMALMQASSMAAPPKKMMAPLGHGPPPREGPDRGPQSHMILPSGMSCPPLVRTHLGNLGWKQGCYMLNCSYCAQCKPKELSKISVFKKTASTFVFTCALSSKFNCYLMFNCWFDRNLS